MTLHRFSTGRPPGWPFRRRFQHAKARARGTNTNPGLAGDFRKITPTKVFIMPNSYNIINRLPLPGPLSSAPAVREQRVTTGLAGAFSHRDQTPREGRP